MADGAKKKARTAEHLNPLCNTPDAVTFVKTFQIDAAKLASEIQVPAENILGLAAQESEWGRGRIAQTYNNYFSMHAPAPLEKGEAPSLKDPKVKLAIYDSFLIGGESFLKRFGGAVRGKSDPHDFAKALVLAKFNSGDSATGGRDGFAAYLATIIANVKIRLACP